MRLGPALILIGAGAYLGKRAMDIAREEGKPVSEVLSSLPGRIAEDVKSLPDDLRMAGREGKLASDREIADLDARLRPEG